MDCAQGLHRDRAPGTPLSSRTWGVRRIVILLIWLGATIMALAVNGICQEYD